MMRVMVVVVGNDKDAGANKLNTVRMVEAGKDTDFVVEFRANVAVPQILRRGVCEGERDATPK